MKRFIIVLLCLIMMLECTASACTAIYVGRDVSADGSILIARSNDHQSNWANHLEVTERVEDQPGRVMPVDNAGTVLAPIPATTYRYVSTPWMDSTCSINGCQKDAAVCVNEYGVSMTMSVTAFSNTSALEADPLIPNGLTECTANDLVICQSRTAREAVEKLLALIDEYGSSEINIALISDREETWYVEMYTGHQYAAVKLPKDAVCVFGNEFTLRCVEDYAESIVSPGLAEIPEKAGFAVRDDAGRLDLVDTYSGEDIRMSYSHMRTWIGHKLFAPSVYGDYEPHGDYPLTFAPEEKVSLQDVMEAIRNRYEGTEYDPDVTGRTDMRVIGTDTAMSVHVLQIRPDLPEDRCSTVWFSTAPAVYGVFVPVSNACGSVSEVYAANQPAEEAGQFDTDYPWFVMKALNTLCMLDIPTYGAPVRDFWRQAEADMIDGMQKVLNEGTDAEIEEYCRRVQQQAFEDGKVLLNQVNWTMGANANTMKNGRDPETGEVLDTLIELPPMEVEPVGDAYKK